MQNETVCDEISCQQEKTTNAAAQLNFKNPKINFELLFFEEKPEIKGLKKFQKFCEFCTRLMEHLGRFFLYNLVPAKKNKTI